MTIHSLCRVQKLPLSLKQAWDFFSNPHYLAQITPPHLNFSIYNEESLPSTIYSGMIITYSVTPLFPIAWTWVTEITHVEEEKYFVDEQKVGPYALWHHSHFFEALEEGVEIKDLIYYKLRFSILGDRLFSHWVEKELKAIFDYRQQKLKELFG